MSIKISLPILKSQKELKNTIFYQRNIESIEYKYYCEVCGNYGRLYELKNSWLLKRMQNPNTVENAKLKCIELNNIILITRPIIDYMRSFLQERNF